MKHAYKDYTFNVDIFKGDFVTLKMGPRGISLTVATQPELRSVQEILQLSAELIESLSIVENGGLYFENSKTENAEPSAERD